MRWILLFLLFIGFKGVSQVNLVPNSGFESNDFSYCGSISDACLYCDLRFNKYWETVDYWTTPKYTTGCFLSPQRDPGTPNINCKSNPLSGPSQYISQTVRTGNYSGHLVFNGDLTESLVVELKENLKKGNYYYYEFYYNISHKSNNYLPSDIGGLLLEERPSKCGMAGKINREDYTPDFTANQNLVDDEWQRAFGYFKVDKENLRWLVLQTWSKNKPETTDIHLLLDDIKIIDVGDELCPDEWLFDNMQFNQGKESYQASNKIVIGKGADPEVIDGDVIIKSGSYLKLKAPEVIEMIPGFTVEEGAKYIAEIAPCESSPCTFPSINEVYAICKPREQLNIVDQTSVKNNWIVEWSPSQYVDDPSSISPAFIPPSGNGVIEMKLKVTNLCGDKIEKKIDVYYSDNFPNEAELEISNFQKDVSFLSFDVAIQNSPADIKITIPEVNYEENHELFPVDGQNKYHWDSPNEKLLSCETYTVIVESTNRCSGENKSQSFTWDRSSSLSTTGTTNILVTASETNNKLFVYGQGIRSYSTVIKNRDGITIEKENGVVRTNPAPFFTAKGRYSSSTYFYVVTFTGCNGEKQVNNGYFQWINNRAPESEELIDSTELSNTNDKVYDLKFAAYEPDEVIEKDVESNFYEGVDEIKLFPNPVNSQLNLSSKGIMEGDIIIYNNIGKIVIQQKVNDYQKVIQTDELKNGLYLLKVVEKDGTEHHFKLIKQ